MSVTTFTTQRQLTMKNMPPAALTGPMAQQQKILLYVLPFIFAVSGVNFPIGVLIYWTTTNLWSMGQQFYTIRRMPAPGSQAEKALKERQARKAAARGETIEEASTATALIDEKPRGQRQQPKRKDRAKARPAQPGDATAASVSDAVVDPTEDVPEDAADAPPPAPRKKRKGPSGGGSAPGGTSRS
jgi:YidC/Oxa1 family membrane protein insertase